MAVSTVKRSQFRTFFNTGTTATPVWSLIGDGVTSAKVSYNPQTNETVYIHQDTGVIDVESYKPTMPISAVAKNEDPVFEKIDTLRKTRAVLTASEAEIVNVWLYETPTGSTYPAERQAVTVQIDDFGGDGGKPAEINYTLNYKGDAVLGTFNPTTLAFVAS